MIPQQIVSSHISNDAVYEEIVSVFTVFGFKVPSNMCSFANLTNASTIIIISFSLPFVFISGIIPPKKNEVRESLLKAFVAKTAHCETSQNTVT